MPRFKRKKIGAASAMELAEKIKAASDDSATTTETSENGWMVWGIISIVLVAVLVIVVIVLWRRARVTVIDVVSKDGSPPKRLVPVGPPITITEGEYSGHDPLDGV